MPEATAPLLGRALDGAGIDVSGLVSIAFAAFSEVLGVVLVILPPAMNARISSFKIRPLGPLPGTAARSTAFSFAILRTAGVVSISLSDASGGAVEYASAAVGCVEGE